MNVSGNRDKARNYFSERQRFIVLDFDSVEDAEAWDAAGQPLSFLPNHPLVTVPYRSHKVWDWEGE